ncbi:MAG: hypothetical protein KJ692_14165 [Verrucomicrobia bacterium]|nr:hypothetical protein [Verrucomicrobiota bacterium]
MSRLMKNRRMLAGVSSVFLFSFCCGCKVADTDTAKTAPPAVIGQVAAVKLEAIPVGQTPFLTHAVEVTPGGKLMLHARIMPVEGLADDKYTLVLSLPGACSLSKLQITGTDNDGVFNHKVGPVDEQVRAVIAEGEKRTEIYYRPDMQNLCEGIELNFGYINEFRRTISYTPVIKFIGSFDWCKFSKEVTTPDNAIGVRPLLLKWPDARGNSPLSGALHVRNLNIREADSGKLVYELPAGQETTVTVVQDVKTAHWFGTNMVPLTPSMRYAVTCEAKGDLKSKSESAQVTLSGDTVFFTRNFIFDVAADAVLPAKLIWRITDGNQHVYREGAVALIPAGKTLTPKKLETSVWVAETRLSNESTPVQKIFVDKFATWGLNTIMPQFDEPRYGASNDTIEFSFPVIQEAKRRGMQVRAYLHVRYSDAARPYCEAHPEYWAETYKGDKSAGYRVCLTHILDGGKYDTPPSGAGAGLNNPWLARYCEILNKRIEVNAIDSIWMDHEIAGAPYRKDLPPEKRKPSDVCLCKRCIRAFQDYAKLDHLPTTNEICGELYEKVTDFKCWQHRRLIEMLHDSARRVNPRVTFGIYSGWPTDRIEKGLKLGDFCRQAYGVDWAMLAPAIDIAMMRTGGPLRGGWGNINAKCVESLRSVLTKGLKAGQPLPKIIISLYGPTADGNWSQRCAAFQSLKIDIVKMVVLYGSTSGWSYSAVWGMDDQLIAPIRQANSLLAKYEDFIIDGKRADNLVELSGENVSGATWQLRDRVITFVFNYDAAPREFSLKRKDLANSAEKVSVPGYDCLVHEWARP